MREQYGTAVGAAPDRASGSKDDDDDEHADGGGFLTRADDVVQHYNLPRPVHVVFASPPPRSPAPDDDRTPTPAPSSVPDEPTLPLLDLDSDVQYPADNPVENRGIPKSMAELAAEAAAAQISNSENADAVSVTGHANKEGRTVRPRARKRMRTRENEDEDDWQSDDADSEDTGRTRDAKRVRTRARAGRRDRPTIVPVQMPTSDRVLRARKK